MFIAKRKSKRKSKAHQRSNKERIKKDIDIINFNILQLLNIMIMNNKKMKDIISSQ